MGNVPGWPVSVACESLNKTYGQLELLDAIHDGLSLPLLELPLELFFFSRSSLLQLNWHNEMP